jgi:hypothetical protein
MRRLAVQRLLIAFDDLGTECAAERTPAMARGTIPDYLLKTSVGIKVEAGISASRIRALVNEFAAEQPRHQPASDIAGFLMIEDIPQVHREGFLRVLSALSVPG